jgi:beta-lactamase class A
MHRDVALQYRNWCEPVAAVQLLQKLSDPLLIGWMRDTPSAPNRIKGRLPAGTVVIHKTGTSGTDHGVTHATNDVGLIVLPDGRQLAIAVFVTDSAANEAMRDSVIARIAKAVYDASR